MQISEKQLRAAVLAYHGDDFFDCFEEGSEFANEKIEAIRAALEAALSAAEPVAWLPVRKWEQMTAAEPWLTNVVYSEDQADFFPCIPLYAAPPAPSVAVKAEDFARQLWGYFKGDSTGGTTAMQWFDNNKSLGGPAHLIDLCRSTLSAQVQDVAGVDLTLSALQSAHVTRQEEWCPDVKPDLSFRGNELGGECGEAQNVIKKLERERHGWRGSRDTVEHLAEELADVIHCTMLVAITAGIDLQQSVVGKFNDTSTKNGLSTMLPAAPAKQEGGTNE